ncbi:MAG: hypothetical protein ABI169_18880 [Chitinophagaceae bacterium]
MNSWANGNVAPTNIVRDEQSYWTIRNYFINNPANGMQISSTMNSKLLSANLGFCLK